MDNRNPIWKTGHTICRQVKQAVSNGLFPKTCASCGRYFHSETGQNWQDNAAGEPPHRIFSQIMAGNVCPTCLDGFIPVKSPMCTMCGQMYRTTAGEDHLCGHCLSGAKPFVFARACGEYSGTLMTLVHAYKYREKIGLGRPLGKLLHAHFLKHFTGVSIDFITPVPLHRQKLVARGFDQVMRLLDHWPWCRQGPGVKGINNAVLSDTLLVRIKNTETQTGLNRMQRGKNMKGAFAVTNALQVEKRSVLLIDDVYTTGATLEACAFALKRAGASRVYFLTLARAM
jgi:ComF family protein